LLKGLCADSLTAVVRTVKILAVDMHVLSLDAVIQLMGFFPCLEKLYIEVIIDTSTCSVHLLCCEMLILFLFFILVSARFTHFNQGQQMCGVSSRSRSLSDIMTSLSRQLCWNSIGAPSHKLAF
jgi:hypothetical protein